MTGDSKSDSLTAEVAKAYPNDSGRGIARLAPNQLQNLGLNPGDFVRITGEDSTLAKVWRADRQDWNAGAIRLDGFTRQNLNVDVGEAVTFEKFEPEEAQRVVLAPPKEAEVEFTEDSSDSVKRQILKKGLSIQDMVPVMSSRNNPILQSLGQAIPLIVVETDPDEPVFVTEDTELDLRSE